MRWLLVVLALGGCQTAAQQEMADIARQPVPEVPVSQRMVLSDEQQKEIVGDCMLTGLRKTANKEQLFKACSCMPSTIERYVPIGQLRTDSPLLVFVAAKCYVQSSTKLPQSRRAED